ncbi:MAG: hypothetical protein V1827_05920 [Candidatus Micrarchaeota archaeon]
MNPTQEALAAKPVLKMHLSDMEAIAEYGRALDDVNWRGDLAQVRQRAQNVLPKDAVLSAVKAADATDSQTRAVLKLVSEKSEHREVREAAIKKLEIA